jgi:hypothetical protein
MIRTVRSYLCQYVTKVNNMFIFGVKVPYVRYLENLYTDTYRDIGKLSDKCLPV